MGICRMQGAARQLSLIFKCLRVRSKSVFEITVETPLLDDGG
jgi:hypothetical protein